MTQTIAINPYAGRSLRMVGMILWIVAIPVAALSLINLIGAMTTPSVSAYDNPSAAPFWMLVLSVAALIAGILMYRAGNRRIAETQEMLNRLSK